MLGGPAGGKGLGTHNLVHSSEINQMLKAVPHHGDARPNHRLSGSGSRPIVRSSAPRWPGRGCAGRGGDAMNAAVKRLPLRLIEEHRTGRIGQGARQHGGVENAPGNDAVERQTAFEPVSAGQLTPFDTAAALEHLMPDLNVPPCGVPVEPFQCIRGGVDRDRGQQHPFDRRHAWGRGGLDGQTAHTVRVGGRSLAWRLTGRRSVTSRQRTSSSAFRAGCPARARPGSAPWRPAAPRPALATDSVRGAPYRDSGRPAPAGLRCWAARPGTTHRHRLPGRRH